MIYESLNDVIQIVNNSEYAYCHYITPNDVGATGGHQYGFHIAKNCYKVFFDDPGIKGTTVKKEVEIKWQNDFITHSVATYYGEKTRNEYRLTKYGKDFEFLKDDYIGSLLIMARTKDCEYNGYVLNDQDNIENFMYTFNLDITKGNQFIYKSNYIEPEKQVSNELDLFVNLHSDFPDTKAMASFIRDCVINANKYTPQNIVDNADSILIKWIETEYLLFKKLENKIYEPIYSQSFFDCQSLIDFSNTILNRRKSRAGKSLEHHLSAIFTLAELKFQEQGHTENNKKPDFLFPDEISYHCLEFPADKLTMLGAKTTCKDRWRQVLNEADRIENKHLFTLQCGVSKNQLKEMRDANLTLVIPKEHFKWFIPEFHNNIISLNDFILMVRERQK